MIASLDVFKTINDGFNEKSNTKCTVSLSPSARMYESLDAEQRSFEHPGLISALSYSHENIKVFISYL